MKPSQIKFPKIKCPVCDCNMRVGTDNLAGDYYAQCDNVRCNFDGLFANTPEQLAKDMLTLKTN